MNIVEKTAITDLKAEIKEINRKEKNNLSKRNSIITKQNNMKED